MIGMEGVWRSSAKLVADPAVDFAASRRILDGRLRVVIGRDENVVGVATASLAALVGRRHPGRARRRRARADVELSSDVRLAVAAVAVRSVSTRTRVLSFAVVIRTIATGGRALCKQN